ncbi:MAG: hypothetical protein ACRDRU_07105 [Pseudonocardiaceae bacterium]
MSVIVGVHGIAQQQGGRKQLMRDWGPALADGIEIAVRADPVGVSFDLAFYGDLFLGAGHGGQKGAGEDSGLDDLSAAEVDDALADAREALSEEEIAAAAALPPSKAYTRTPRPLQAVLRALDAKFGAAAGMLYLGTLRQVRRYLRDGGLKAAADEIVAAKAGTGCRILIGHSLGSVLALEFVRQHPEHRLDLLLTLGSPLGLRMVQSRLPHPYFGADTPGGIPESLAAWVNVRDVRDPVACAGDLNTWWPGVDDRYVDNEGDAHNVARYLSKAHTGTAIVRAAPHFAPGQAAP